MKVEINKGKEYPRILVLIPENAVDNEAVTAISNVVKNAWKWSEDPDLIGVSIPLHDNEQ